MIDRNCDFCLEFIEPEKSLFYALLSGYGLGSRIIFESDLFVAIPGLGALTEGYVLLLPKKHYFSLGQLEVRELESFTEFKEKTINRMKKFYTNLVCFEHGAISTGRRGGACLDHAHLHICPTPTDLTTFMNKQFDAYPIEKLSDLHKFSREPIQQPYLFYENHDGNKMLYIVPSEIESQYFRRLWASALGMQAQWDWTVFIGEHNMLATIKKLKSL